MDAEIGKLLVVDRSFVHFRETGNCTRMDPAELIGLVGMMVSIMSLVLLTMLGLNVM